MSAAAVRRRVDAAGQLAGLVKLPGFWEKGCFPQLIKDGLFCIGYCIQIWLLHVPDRGGLQANIEVPFSHRASLYASEEVLVRRVERLGELVQLRYEMKS